MVRKLIMRLKKKKLTWWSKIPFILKRQESICVQLRTTRLPELKDGWRAPRPDDHTPAVLVAVPLHVSTKVQWLQEEMMQWYNITIIYFRIMAIYLHKKIFLWIRHKQGWLLIFARMYKNASIARRNVFFGYERPRSGNNL